MATTTRGGRPPASSREKPAKRASAKKAAAKKKSARPRYVPPAPERRWRPRSRSGKRCGYTFDDNTCHKRGAHYCVPRADRAVAFFAECLVHTKGAYARRAFILEPWQEWEIVRPLFGEVIWSPEWGCYVRRYTEAGIILGRKNGKSELAAGIALLLLVADDEEASEVYGAAKDRAQAKKVWEPADRMRQLSPVLADRLNVNRHTSRIFDETTGSYYEVIPCDAKGELGANPHGFVLDEVLSQPDGSLWEAMVTAEGTRLQPMFLCISTETNEPGSFGAKKIDEFARVQEDPSRAPHVFAYVRRLPHNDEELEQLRRAFPGHRDLPVSCDPFDEANWYWPNPALGSFLQLSALRKAAEDAKLNPEKENGFRQFRCNQRVQQVTRWMPLTLWDETAGMVDEDRLAGRTCFGGLDLASTTDLAAWVLLFPPADPADPAGVYEVLWRFWTPEAQIPHLDRHLGGMATVWARNGYLGVTEGDWIDYWGDPANGGRSSNTIEGVRDPLAIHPQIEADAARYRIVNVGYDQKEATATAQHMQSLGLKITPVYQGFSLSPALKELMRLVVANKLRHGGHPVARWNADSVEVKANDEEKIKIVKPMRRQSGKRIDGFAALGNAIRVHQLHVEETQAVAATASATGTTGPVGDFFRPTGRLSL